MAANDPKSYSEQELRNRALTVVSNIMHGQGMQPGDEQRLITMADRLLAWLKGEQSE